MRFKDKFWLAWWSLVSVFIFYAWGWHQVRLQLRQSAIETITLEDRRESLLAHCKRSRRIRGLILDLSKQLSAKQGLQPQKISDSLYKLEELLWEGRYDVSLDQLPALYSQDVQELDRSYLGQEKSLHALELAFESKDKETRERYLQEALKRSIEVEGLALQACQSIEKVLKKSGPKHRTTRKSKAEKTSGDTSYCGLRLWVLIRNYDYFWLDSLCSLPLIK